MDYHPYKSEDLVLEPFLKTWGKQVFTVCLGTESVEDDARRRDFILLPDLVLGFAFAGADSGIDLPVFGFPEDLLFGLDFVLTGVLMSRP